MMRTLWVATFLAVGCGAPAPIPDAGAPACGVAPVTFAKPIPEGTTVDVTLRPLRTDVAITVSSGDAVLIDATTLRVRAPYGSMGHASVVLAASCSDAQGTMTLDVLTQTLAWKSLATWAPDAGPDAREHPAMFIDPAAPDGLWLYGGYGFVPAQYTVREDLWRFDFTTAMWTAFDAPGAPPVAGTRMTLGPQPGMAWLFGGQAADQSVSSDVYTLTLGASPTWSKVAATGTVKGQTLGAFVFDAPRNRFVSVCGFTGSTVDCNVYALALDGSTWSTVTVPGQKPTPRYGFFYFYDTVNERVILFSGAQYPTATDSVNPASDVWALSLGGDQPQWAKLLDADPNAIGRRNGCSAYDPEHQRFFVWSGTADAATAVDQLSVLDLSVPGNEHWTALVVADAPIARGSCTGIYDSVRKRVVFGFGNDVSHQFADLWALELEPLPGSE